jgi:hypothetical protein
VISQVSGVRSVQEMPTNAFHVFSIEGIPITSSPNRRATFRPAAVPRVQPRPFSPHKIDRPQKPLPMPPMLFIFTVLTNDSETPDRHDHVPLSGNAPIMHTCLTPLKCPQKIGIPLGINDRRLTSADFPLKIHRHSKLPPGRRPF